MEVSVFEYGNGKAMAWHESNTDIRLNMIVKEGAAVTKAGGSGNVPKGGVDGYSGFQLEKWSYQ
jgi:hypothetical protein